VVESDNRSEADAELKKLREENRQVSDVLGLIQRLTGAAIRCESVAELFETAFRTLFGCVPFDIAVAVMLEQNLDLFISTREAAHGQVSEKLMGSIRATLQQLVAVSFEHTDAVVINEANDLPGEASGADCLAHETHALLTVGTRVSGLLVLYRAEPAFSRHHGELLEIFSTQISMLLGNIAARQRILNLAETDDLTGIWNKRYFRRQLPQEVERARVYALPLSLLIFDLDDFKQINDSFGHTVGDVVLSELCGAVREMLRPPDVFARFGGDEFAVILPHTDLGGARSAADRILQKVNNLTIPADEEGSIRCAISIGIADYRPGDSAQDLVRRADEKLYLSKRAGKNRYTA
jgi:diguanylate cyclase (GGDEF)-like protein